MKTLFKPGQDYYIFVCPAQDKECCCRFRGLTKGDFYFGVLNGWMFHFDKNNYYLVLF